MPQPTCLLSVVRYSAAGTCSKWLTNIAASIAKARRARARSSSQLFAIRTVISGPARVRHCAVLSIAAESATERHCPDATAHAAAVMRARCAENAKAERVRIVARAVRQREA